MPYNCPMILLTSLFLVRKGGLEPPFNIESYHLRCLKRKYSEDIYDKISLSAHYLPTRNSESSHSPKSIWMLEKCLPQFGRVGKSVLVDDVVEKRQLIIVEPDGYNMGSLFRHLTFLPYGRSNEAICITFGYIGNHRSITT